MRGSIEHLLPHPLNAINIHSSDLFSVNNFERLVLVNIGGGKSNPLYIKSAYGPVYVKLSDDIASNQQNQQGGITT